MAPSSTKKWFGFAPFANGNPSDILRTFDQGHGERAQAKKYIL
jgi:hypothetical protein